MKKALQFFDKQYLEHCRTMSGDEIAEYLDQFRRLQAIGPVKKRLISLRISEPVLESMKLKARAHGIAYQTQIQQLIEDWVKK